MIGVLTVLPLIFGPADGLGVDPPHTQIYGGDVVDSCGWPSAVYLDGGGACTGTLIHPRVVLTAAHCVSNASPSNVRFGENAQTATKLTDTEYCRQSPTWTGATAQGQDYGYCLLKAPVTTVPIIPVASGCEQTAIRTGARIMHVGFGQDQDGNFGRKKMLDTTINAITGSGELISGTFSEIICNGDSGGPTFVYLDPSSGGDGTWRVAAIHSWAQGADPVDPNCNSTAGSVLVTQAIPWIEEDSGIDITPCTDGDDWAPTAHCGDQAEQPWIGSGNYTSGCEGNIDVEFSAVCGPGLDETPDATAPVVTVVTPSDAQEFEPDGGSASVQVTVEATDEGWGVEAIELTIRSVSSGEEQVEVRDEWQSWDFSATLPAGGYEVDVTATDHAGNASEPVTVCFGVGEPGCGDVGAETGSGTDTDDPVDPTDDPEPEPETGSTTDAETTGDTMPPASGGDSGCGCRSQRPPTWGFALGVVLLAYRRRR